MTEDPNIYLVGYRCTGKTSVGKRMAARLQRRFIDTDVLIAEQLGASIADLVQRQGWEAFRSEERSVIATVCRLSGIVVATGGGVVLADTNRHALRRSGRVIWLKASPEIIKQRLTEDRDSGASRPPLSDAGVMDEIDTVMQARTRLYTAAAHFTVDTDHRTVEDVCDRIVERLGLRPITG